MRLYIQLVYINTNTQGAAYYWLLVWNNTVMVKVVCFSHGDFEKKSILSHAERSNIPRRILVGRNALAFPTVKYRENNAREYRFLNAFYDHF